MHLPYYDMRYLLSNVMQYSGMNTASLALRGSHDRLRVLCYHRVMEPSRPGREDVENALVTSTPAFERQMEIIAARFVPVNLSEVIAWLNNRVSLPPRAVLVTFDDGWVDTYTDAYPIMKRLGIPGLIFLTADFIGTSTLYWPDFVRGLLKAVGRVDVADSEIRQMKLMSSDQRQALIAQMIQNTGGWNADSGRFANVGRGQNLSWQQVREMADNGFDLGSHTCSHIMLPQESDQRITRELVYSSDIIAGNTGRRPLAFAYPDGQYNDSSPDFVEAAGYSCAFTCDEGMCSRRMSPYLLPRLSVHDGVCTCSSGEFSSAMFLTYLAGTIPWRYRRNRC